MKFEILDKAEVKDYSNCYVVEVTAMFGDADGYETFEMGPFSNDSVGLDYLEQLVITCREMENAYQHGRGGCDDYQSDDPDAEGYVAGFNLWFGGEIIDELGPDDPRYEFSHDWPHTPDGYGSQASFDGFEVFYYNKNGVKFKVKVVD